MKKALGTVCLLPIITLVGAFFLRNPEIMIPFFIGAVISLFTVVGIHLLVE